MFELAILVAFVLAVTELAKIINIFNAKYLPLFSLGFGLLVGLTYLDFSVKENALIGAMIGLSAAGLFDQSKILTKKGA